MTVDALNGVKVVDFGWIAAAPVIARLLADYGAQVIRIESQAYVDTLRMVHPHKDGIPGINRGGRFAHVNINKYGMALNLRNPKGLEVAKKIIAWADVVVEGFRPGGMAKLGLGYEDIKKINPKIIMVSTSMLGQWGPAAGSTGFGYHLSGLAGFCHFSGWPDREPVVHPAAYTDWLAPPLAIAAIIAALEARLRTNRGQWIDLSQFECALQFIAPALLDCSVNGQQGSRMGNHHSWAAPHGAYRCRGNDRWCVIAVFNDEEWRSLCRIMGQPAWADDPGLNSVLGRKARENELDRLIEAWTINLTPEEIVKQLQASGIAAGMVEDGRDIVNDTQLKYRHHFQPLNHPEMGEYRVEAVPCSLSQTPSQLRMPGPCLGEHTEYICTQILGMSDEEFTSLLAEGVFS